LAVGKAGGVAPVQIYTSYDVAVATAPQVSVAVVCVAMVELLAGVLLVAQPGTGITTAAVVNAVALVVPHVVAAPLAFLGAIYQLYKVEAVKLVAL
jgi:hypothetical protein